MMWTTSPTGFLSRIVSTTTTGTTGQLCWLPRFHHLPSGSKQAFRPRSIELLRRQRRNLFSTTIPRIAASSSSSSSSSSSVSSTGCSFPMLNRNNQVVVWNRPTSRNRTTNTETLSYRPEGPLYPVKAVHLGQTIDISAVLNQLFSSTPVTSTTTTTTTSSPSNSTNTITTTLSSTPPAISSSSTTVISSSSSTSATTSPSSSTVATSSPPSSTPAITTPTTMASPPPLAVTSTPSTPPTLALGKKKVLKNSLVLEFPLSTNGALLPLPKYLAVFRFGSVVSINMDPQEFQNYLNLLRKFVTDPSGSERKEEFAVMLLQENDFLPSTQFYSVVTADYCIVPTLDLDGVVIISHIVGQSVALDTYNDTADDLLNKFATLNSAYRSSGTFHASDKSFLFRSVAHNNAILIDLISKIRLKDRADMAWKISKYEDIHYGLKNEFEIDDRFSQIEYKLNLIQQNSKFFLEVLNSEKSTMLEWAIVWLIGIECVLMCIDMSGQGEDLFRYIQSLAPHF